LKPVDSLLSLFTAPKTTYKTLNKRPNNNKNINTVVSGAVVYVVMNIVIIIIIVVNKARRGSGFNNTRHCKLPRVPSLKQ